MKSLILTYLLLTITSIVSSQVTNNDNCNVKIASDPFNETTYLISEYETIYTYSPNIHGIFDYYSAFLYKDSLYYFRIATKMNDQIEAASITSIQIKFENGAALDLMNPTKNTEITKKKVSGSKGWSYVEFKLTEDDLTKFSSSKITLMRFLTYGISLDLKIQKKEVALKQCNCITNFEK